MPGRNLTSIPAKTLTIGALGQALATAGGRRPSEKTEFLELFPKLCIFDYRCSVFVFWFSSFK